MVNERLIEIQNELEKIANSGKGACVSVGLSTKFAQINNVVEADEILFYEDMIRIQSGHFDLNLDLTDGASIVKYDYGVESEYYINKDDTELYISLMGA